MFWLGVCVGALAAAVFFVAFAWAVAIRARAEASREDMAAVEVPPINDKGYGPHGGTHLNLEVMGDG